MGVPVVFVFLGVKGEDFLEKSVGQKGAPGSPPPHHFEVPIVCGVLERWRSGFGGRECWSKWKQAVWYTYIYISVSVCLYIYIMYIRVYRVYNFICLFSRYVMFLDSNTSSSYIYIYIYIYINIHIHTFCSHIHMYITTVIVFIILLCLLVCWYLFNYYYSLHVCVYKKNVFYSILMHSYVEQYISWWFC